MNAWQHWTSLERIIVIIVVVLLAILAAYVVVALSPLVFGEDAPANITPVPEPVTPTPYPPPTMTPPGTIPPLPPFQPIALQTDRAYVPVVFGGVACSEDLFYACGGAN